MNSENTVCMNEPQIHKKSEVSEMCIGLPQISKIKGRIKTSSLNNNSGVARVWQSMALATPIWAAKSINKAYENSDNLRTIINYLFKFTLFETP